MKSLYNKNTLITFAGIGILYLAYKTKKLVEIKEKPTTVFGYRLKPIVYTALAGLGLSLTFYHREYIITSVQNYPYQEKYEEWSKWASTIRENLGKTAAKKIERFFMSNEEKKIEGLKITAEIEKDKLQTETEIRQNTMKVQSNIKLGEQRQKFELELEKDIKKQEINRSVRQEKNKESLELFGAKKKKAIEIKEVFENSPKGEASLKRVLPPVDKRN